MQISFLIKMKNLHHDFFLRSSEEKAKSLPCFGAALYLPWDAMKAGNGPAHLRWCDIVLLHPPEGVCNNTMGIVNSHKNHLPSANTFNLQKAQDYQIRSFIILAVLRQSVSRVCGVHRPVTFLSNSGSGSAATNQVAFNQQRHCFSCQIAAVIAPLQ